MSKLVDKERLAKLAKGLYDKLHEEIGVAVEAEATRAKAAEAKALEDANKYTDEKITEVNNAAITLGGRVADLEQFQTEQLQNNTDQLAAINAKVEKTVYEEKVSALEEKDTEIAGLVTAEANRAKGVEGELDAAIKAEASRADTEEKRIVGLVEAEASRAAGKEGELAQAIADEKGRAEGKEAELADDITEVDGKVAKNIADIADHETRVAANEADIARLDGDVNVEGSVKKQIKDAIDEVNGDAQALAGRVGALETFRDTTYPAAEAKVREDFAAADTIIRSDFAAADQALETKLNGKIATDIAAESALRQAAEAQVLADAKAHAEQKIADLVNSAPEAMDTLGELAKAINDHQDVYDSYVEAVTAEIGKAKADAIEEAAKKDTALHTTISAEIDADVLVEKGRAEGQEAAIRQELADEKAALQAEIDADVLVEQQRAEAAEEALSGRLDVVETYTEGVEAAIKQAIDDVVGHDAKDGQPATKLFLEVDQARAAADQAQQEVDAVEGRMTTAEGEIDALQAFVQGHDHTAMEANILKNANAIALLNGNAEAEGSVAHAVDTLHTTVKGEMAQVVASLNVKIENDTLQIGLGSGVSFVKLNEFTLDMATDADIEAIINGLGQNN